MSKHDPFKDLGEIYFALCKNIGTPRSLGCWLRFKYAEFAQLIEVEINPTDYITAHEYSLDFACTEFLKKNEVIPAGIDRRARALSKFNSAELQCKQTNHRLRTATPNGAVNSVFHAATKKIADILGPFNWSACIEQCKWGPGGTFSIPKRHAYPDVKFASTLSVTWGALPLAKTLINLTPSWMQALSHAEVAGPYSVLDSAFEVVPGNKVVMVPKNAKTDRTIAMEPTANSFLQQGLGQYIRKRLRKFGVDLNNQEINQTWASLAYDLDLCTVDLSSASDTNAKELVSALLPLEWYLVLDSVRSKSYSFEGEWHPYDKFSSMGNAFTFELETLIFYALTWACTVETNEKLLWSVNAYGDDIICHQDVYPLLVEVFQYAGYSINLEKSHADGPYFESCGEHFFRSYNVTPVYQKKEISGAEVVRCHNRLYRLGRRIAGWSVPSDHVTSALSFLRRQAVGTGYDRTFLHGDDVADDGFLVLDSEFYARSKFHRNYGWRCVTFSERPRKRPADEYGYLANTLHGADLRHLVNAQSVPVSPPLRGMTRVNGPGKMKITGRWAVTA